MGGNAAAKTGVTERQLVVRHLSVVASRTLLYLFIVAGASAHAGTELPQITAVDRKVIVDGVLEEWGTHTPFHIRAGDGPVGLRGGFNGDVDHFAEVYLMWSAEHLYVAVVVEDDVQDVAQILPEETVWAGADGQRKDKMYYFDHLKVFVRAPRANLGFNVWVAPADAGAANVEISSGPAFIWGSQQRSPGSRDLPVQAGSAVAPGLYTYELAIPWAWLQVHPAEGMQFDSMFLLADSDVPALSLEEKVAQKGKWIWWKEKIQLKGTPPGWQPPPGSIVDQVEKGIAQFRETVPKLVEQEEPATEPVEVVSVPPPADPVSSAVEDMAVATVPGQAAPPLASPYLPDLEQMERTLQRRPTAPAFIDEITDQATAGQARALFRSMAGALQRLNRDQISGRVDIIATDAAESAGTEKMVARAFAIGLLERVLEDLEAKESALRLALVEVAGNNELSDERVVEFIRRSSRSLHKWFQKNNLYGLQGAGVPTTGEVIERASSKSKLSTQQARQVLADCLDYWIL